MFPHWGTRCVLLVHYACQRLHIIYLRLLGAFLCSTLLHGCFRFGSSLGLSFLRLRYILPLGRLLFHYTSASLGTVGGRCNFEATRCTVAFSLNYDMYGWIEFEEGHEITRNFRDLPFRELGITEGIPAHAPTALILEQSVFSGNFWQALLGPIAADCATSIKCQSLVSDNFE